MDNPDDYTLFAGPITAALTRSTGVQSTSMIRNLQGLTALSLDFDFVYGSGGSTCAAIVQAVPGNGARPYDVARADFAKVSRRVQLNLEGLLSKGATAYADLSVEGVNDGVLCSQYQVIVLVDTTGGNYAGTTLNVSAYAR